ncbi:MAG: hypothetical protein WCI73_09870, partial [Phycisphaerae bacterium]
MDAIKILTGISAPLRGGCFCLKGYRGMKISRIHFVLTAMLAACVRFANADVDPHAGTLMAPDNERVFQHEDTHPFDSGTGASEPVLDLRYLNEKQAGQSGFVTRSPSGSEFLLGDGTPVRFWAVNSNTNGLDDKQIEQHARWLARMGVNMVRVSGATLQSKVTDAKITDIAEDSLQVIWRAVAAFRKQGIYTTIHPYWAQGSGADLTNWG